MSLKKKLTWSVEWDERARKELRKLDSSIQKEILNYLRTRITGSDDPHCFGKPLTGSKVGLWRYRIGSFRLICKFENHTLVVVVIGIGHRKEVYN